MSGKVYKLKTLADIYEKVPVDRIESCMAEIAKHMITVRAQCPSGGTEFVRIRRILWCDDGKDDLTMTLTRKESV